MLESKLRNELIDSLVNIYSLDIIPVFAGFLQGEQAVLLALSQLRITTASDICKATGIAKNRMSAIVNSLKKKNYIGMSPDPVDKRKINLHLTGMGNEVISAKEAQANIIIDRFIDVSGEENIKELIRIVNMAVEKLKGAPL